MSAALVESVRRVIALDDIPGEQNWTAADDARGCLDLPAILAALTEAESLRAQVAAGQAREVALREACGLGSRRLGYWCDLHGSLSEDRAALTDMQAALSAPTDTAALRAMLEKVWMLGYDAPDATDGNAETQRTTDIDRVLGGS